MKTQNFEKFRIPDTSLGNVLGGIANTSPMASPAQCKIKCSDGTILSSPGFATSCTTNGTPKGTIEYVYIDKHSGIAHTLSVSCDDSPPVQV